MAINFNVMVQSPTRWTFAPPSLGIFANKRYDGILEIRQDGPVQTIASGFADTDGTGRVLTLGFIQTLVESNRTVTFADGRVARTIQPQLPIKDGRGDPWYKDEVIGEGAAEADADPFADPFGENEPGLHLSNIKLFANERAERVDFHIGVDDNPKFRYPPVAVERNITFGEKFVLCLVARLQEQFFVLHKIKWSVDIVTSPIEGEERFARNDRRRFPTGALRNGVVVLESISYQQPHVLVAHNNAAALPSGDTLLLGGDTANRSLVEKWA